MNPEGDVLVDTHQDLRFEVPLYTVVDAARIVDVPVSTLSNWARGYVRRFTDQPDVSGHPIVTYISPDGPRRPSIPFIGLTEALVLAAIRRSGVPMQRIRPALQTLESELGIDHALGSRKLYTDGAELLYDYGTSTAIRRLATPHSNWWWFEAASGCLSKRFRSISVESNTPQMATPS